MSAEERQQIAEVVGIGAVKYADLCQNRTSDYIFRLGQDAGDERQHGDVHAVRLRPQPQHLPQGRRGRRRAFAPTRRCRSLDTPHERALALQLLRFEEALTAAAAEYQPSVITAYLWDLAKTLQRLLPELPGAEGRDAGAAREPAAAVRPDGAGDPAGPDLLGIRTVERM